MTLYETLTEAVNALSSRGYTSPDQLKYWEDRIRKAARESLTPDHVLQGQLRDTLNMIYQRQVVNGGILKQHIDIPKFTIDRIKPRLYAELDRRIIASANLIVLNREQSIDKTIQRFSGWATSIPVGGSVAVDKVEEKVHIRKALAQLPFEQRRVIVDQGHKLVGSINETIAADGGAIGGFWHSKFRQPGYDYREDHKERDRIFYMLRNNWALVRGLVKPGPGGYYDDGVKVAQLPFCSCSMEFRYSLRGLPDECITVKGKAEQASAREKIHAS